MHRTNLRKVGGSTMLAIPPGLLEALHLKAGATVGISVDHDHLVIDPLHQKKYSMSELLALCDASAPLSSEDREWLEPGTVGGELL